MQTKLELFSNRSWLIFPIYMLAASIASAEITYSGETTGNYYLRNRYYSPLERRFLTEDPHGVNPDGNWNNRFSIKGQYSNGYGLQVYVGHEPINNRDNWGLKKCDKCGPDITGSLLILMARVERDFNKLSEEEQKENCRAPFDIDTANGAWNILSLKGELWPARRDRNPNSDCPSKNCEGTVTYSAGCYSALAVNYAIFGKIGQLCDASWTKTYWMIQYHKRITHGPILRDDLTETIQWASWGFHGGSSTYLPESTHKHCKPCKECLPIRMKYWWKPNLQNY